MEQPIIEHGKAPRVSHGKSTNKQVFDYVLAHLDELGPEDNIFFGETNKKKQQTLYMALKRFAKRNNLPMTIKFYSDGIRVWKTNQ